MASWSDLINDALERILMSLSLHDHHRFSAVCQNWRSVVKNRHKDSSPAQQLPWLMMREDDSTKKHTFYNLTENRHYYIHIPELHGQYWIGSSFGWLFIVDEKFVPQLFNPFTREFWMPPPLPKFDQETLMHRSFVKAILSHDPSKTHDFTVLLIYGRNYSKVVFWRGGENTWTFVPCDYYISDAIFFSGKFYLAITKHLLVISDLGPNPRLMPVMPLFHLGVGYLVDFLGQLLHVERLLTNVGDPAGKAHIVTARFSAHVIHLEEESYSLHLNNIGDYAIFLGVCSPMVIDSRLFPGCKRNSIYFTDMDYRLYGCDDLGVYDFTKDTTEPYYPRTGFHPFRERPVWLTLNSVKI